MSSQKHLLVIRLSAMGDVAMTVHVISALVHQHPKVQVTMLTRHFFKPLFSQLPNVKVYVADVKGKHRGLFGLWKLYKELKELQIDAVADLHQVLRTTILKQFFKLGGFRFAQIDKGRKEKKALTALRNKVFKPLKTTHQRYADVFALLGYPVNLENAPLLSRQPLSEKSRQLLTATNKKRIGIAPFAAFEGKMYPLDLMQQLIAQLSNSTTYEILLFGGGEKERKQLEIWEKQFPNTVQTIGKLTFSEELNLISHIDLMLAMDSGNAHLAALFGVPTLTVWGITHPYAGFYPFGQDMGNALMADQEKFPFIPTSVYGNKMPVGYSEAMRTIRPQVIRDKIQEILAKK